MKVSASILPSSTDKINDIRYIKDLIQRIENSDSDYLHLDIMDGKFVENKTWTMGEVIKFSSFITKKLDVHLMVNDPLKYLNDYAMLNTEYYTFHIEAVSDAKKVIEEIKNVGLKPGIAINPDTSTNAIKSILPLIKLVNVMSVVPGKSGQSFMESVIPKIEELKRLKEENGYDYLIEVDGSINAESINYVNDKVDMVVSASFLHNFKNMQEGIDILRG